MFAVIQRENNQACEEGLWRKRSIPRGRGEQQELPKSHM